MPTQSAQTSRPVIYLSNAKRVLIQLGGTAPSTAVLQQYEAVVGIQQDPPAVNERRYRFQLPEFDLRQLSAIFVLCFPLATKFAVCGAPQPAKTLVTELGALALGGGFEVELIKPSR